MTNEIYKMKNIISEISERCFCAGWLMDIEFYLWDLIEKYPDIPEEIEFGQGTILKNEIKQLKDLAIECDGFWTWMKKSSEYERTRLPDGRYYISDACVFVPMIFWKDIIKVKKLKEGGNKT